MQMGQHNKKIRFPTLNLYSCPRVSGTRVNNSIIPILKYIEPITANRCSQNYQDNFVNPNFCRKLQQRDGMIYAYKKMSVQLPELKNFKALICVCMYNQSKQAINLTLKGIYQNLKHFRTKGLSQKQVAVVLVQDGILKLVKDQKSRTYQGGQSSMVHFYEALDRYQGKPKCELIERINIILDEIQNFDRKGMMGNVTRNKNFPPSIEKNIALVYQNRWKPSITGLDKSLNQDYYLNVFSCFKHTNGTKLSSHLWFFQGFCRYLKPQFCVLLDVGTTPDQTGLLNLLKGFSAGPNIGGVTGFMSVDANFKSLEGGDPEGQKQNACSKCFASIQKAQQYQYVYAHFIDKNAESALGFLHVLPGAWSAYRYQALIKSEKYEPNLLERSYFKMILNPDLQQQGYEEANMYLAEDRILSLGIYCQMDSKYTLKYVPDAIAYTDPMKDHQNLMKQRRRWINSSLFAFLYVFKNYYFSVMESKHNCFRKYITITLSMFLALLSFLFSYITPALYFFVMFATIRQLGISYQEVNDGVAVQVDISATIAQVVCFIYCLIFFAGIGGSLTGNNWTKSAHIVSGAFAFFNFLLFLLVVYNVIFIYSVLIDNPITQSQQITSPDDLFNNPKMVIIIVCIFCTLGSMIWILLIHLPSHAKFVGKILCDWPSYFFYTGAYSQTMVIHGFCNVDDVSWGTKGSTASHGGKKYQMHKVYFVSKWILINAVIAYACIYIDVILATENQTQNGGWVLLAVAILGASTIGIKVIFATMYHLFWLFSQKCCLKLLKDEPQRRQKVDQYWKKQLLNWTNVYQGHI